MRIVDRIVRHELTWAVGISIAFFILVPLLQTLPISLRFGGFPTLSPVVALPFMAPAYVGLCWVIVKVSAIIGRVE